MDLHKNPTEVSESLAMAKEKINPFSHGAHEGESSFQYMYILCICEPPIFMLYLTHFCMCKSKHSVVLCEKKIIANLCLIKFASQGTMILF